MAKDKTETKAKNATNTAPITSHGVTVTDDDFEEVGGLRYVCLPELNEGKPVTGWLVSLLTMPEKFKWQQAILVCLTEPANVVVDDETIQAQPGEDVLIPVSGNLKNNDALLKACVDTKEVIMGRFTYKGEIDTGKPSKMKEFEVKLAFKKKIQRTGAFALHNQPPVGYFTGEVLDKNGAPVKSLVGANA